MTTSLRGHQQLAQRRQRRNVIDVPPSEVLQGVLDEFEGAILTISHDRYFLDRVVDRVVELDDGVLTGFLGGYSDYLERRGR